LQLHQLHGAGAVGRLFRVQPTMRVAGVYRAKATGARTDGAHEHDRSCAGVPAFADVRTLGFFADGGEPVFFHRALDGIEAAARRHGSAQPLRLAAELDGTGAGSRLDAVLDGAEALRRTVFVAAADDGDAFEFAHVEFALT